MHLAYFFIVYREDASCVLLYCLLEKMMHLVLLYCTSLLFIREDDASCVLLYCLLEKMMHLAYFFIVY